MLDQYIDPFYDVERRCYECEDLESQIGNASYRLRGLLELLCEKDASIDLLADAMEELCHSLHVTMPKIKTTVPYLNMWLSFNQQFNKQLVS